MATHPCGPRGPSNLHVIIRVPWKRPAPQQEWTADRDVLLGQYLGAGEDYDNIDWQAISLAVGLPVEECMRRATHLLHRQYRQARSAMTESQDTKPPPAPTTTAQVPKEEHTSHSPHPDRGTDPRHHPPIDFDALVLHHHFDWDEIGAAMGLPPAECRAAYLQRTHTTHRSPVSVSVPGMMAADGPGGSWKGQRLSPVPWSEAPKPPLSQQPQRQQHTASSLSGPPLAGSRPPVPRVEHPPPALTHLDTPASATPSGMSSPLTVDYDDAAEDVKSTGTQSSRELFSDSSVTRSALEEAFMDFNSPASASFAAQSK